MAQVIGCENGIPIFVERNATYMGFIEPTPFLIY